MGPNETTDGIIVNGKFFPCDWISEIVDMVTKRIASDENFLLKLDHNTNKGGQGPYTVADIALMRKRSTKTITRHIRKGLINARKVGKSWIIEDIDYFNYLHNKNAEASA